MIGVSPGAAVGQGHAAADRVEVAVHEALPESDVVVTSSPRDGGELRERCAAAMTVPHVRELHDLSLIDTGESLEASLHLKLPGDLDLAAAHAMAEEVEEAIRRDVPEVGIVQTHLEPLAERAPGAVRTHDLAGLERTIAGIGGQPPRSLRTLETADGLVVLVTLALDGSTSVADAHTQASALSRRIREALPDVADVVVHTEP